MELQAVSREIAANDILFDDFDERPVDCDFVLPEYCPDVASVLKATMKPVIQAKQQSGDSVTADGVATIRVLYLDEERKCVRSVEFGQPFTSVFQLPGGGGRGVSLKLSARTDYVNCRATSPRRLDIHGAFSVRLLATAEGAYPVLSDVAQGDIFTRKQPVTYTVQAGMAEKVFSLSEVLELGSGKKPAEVLIRTEVIPRLTETKVLAGKAILKGEVGVTVFYASDTVAGDTDVSRQSIPFSQIVDVDGLSEDQQVASELTVLSDDVHVSVNQNGESSLLSVGVKLCAAVRGYRSGSAEIVTDAYCTKYPLELTRQRMHIQSLAELRQEVQTVHQMFELPSADIVAIKDLWAEVSGSGAQVSDDRCMLEGRMQVYMLTCNAEGEIAFYERGDGFTLEYPRDGDTFAGDMQVADVVYGLSPSGQVDIKAQVQVNAAAHRVYGGLAVTEVHADEGAAFPPEKAALKIYYANRGESVWDIAKSCHTSMQAVRDENNLPADILEADTMLLVPMM